MTQRRRFMQAVATAATMPTMLYSQKASAAVPLLKQVTIEVGYPPGGGTDVVARLLGDSLRGTYAEAVIIENRAGAGGRLAAEYVKSRTPDGSVLLFTPAFPMIVYPHVYKNMRYDTLTDFAAVAMTHRGVVALSVGPAVPDNVKSVPEFVQWCKANPKIANFGASAGSVQHFAGVLLARDAGMDFELINYKGGAQAITDCIGGHLTSVITAMTEAAPFLTEGKLRVLANSGAERSPSAPNLPTFHELGYKDVVFQDWSGFLAPAKTPPELLAKANAVISAALATPAIEKAMLSLSAPPTPTSQEQFASEIKSGWARYQAIVKSTGFVAEE